MTDVSEQDDRDVAEVVRRSIAEEPSVICDFSPGPSWGFNGIQTLALTEHHLCILQRGTALTARRDLAATALTTIPVSSIRSVSKRTRPGVLGGPVVTLNLATDHGAKTFTTKHTDRGHVFADRLSELTSPTTPDRTAATRRTTEHGT